MAAPLGWLIFQVGWLPGQVFNATRFILYDQGSFLYVVGRIQAGEVLYRDIAWQYGPLAAGWYAGFAAMLGNTPLMLVVASGVAMSIAWIGLVKLVSRAVGFGWAWAGGVLVLLPAMSVPCLRSINHGPHGAVEAMLLVVLALWVSDPRRGAGRAFVAGVMLGVLQLVRFGPQIVAGLLVAGFWLAVPSVRKTPGAAGRALLGIAAGYLAVLAAYAILLCFRLPTAGVLDQLWPSYMVEHYRSTYDSRGPITASLWGAVAVWAPALTAVLACVLGARRLLNSSQQPEATFGLLFLPLYFAVGLPVLFKSSYSVSAHLWFCWPALALWPWWPGKWWVRALPAALAVLAITQNLQGLAGDVKRERAWAAEPLMLPNGQRLWFHGVEGARFGELSRVLAPRSDGSRPRVVVLHAGGGVAHFFDCGRVGRHWWYLSGFVRPWEREQVIGDFLRHDLVLPVRAAFGLEENPGGQQPTTVTLWLPFPEADNVSLLPRLRYLRSLDGLGPVLQITQE